MSARTGNAAVSSERSWLWGCVPLCVLLGGCADEASLGRYGSSTSTAGTGTGASSDDDGAASDPTSGAGPDVATGTTTEGPESDEGADDVKLDMLVPQIATCSVEATEQVELSISTPAGAIEGLHAWWGWEGCCGPMPRLLVADVEPLELETESGAAVSLPVLEILLSPDGSARPGVWMGAQSSFIRFHGEAATAELEAEFTLSGVITYDERSTPPLFEGDIAVEVDGWSVSGHVVAPYCASLDTPACPCE